MLEWTENELITASQSRFKLGNLASISYHVLLTRFYFVNSVRIHCFSGPYFPAFGLNTEIYRVSLRIQSKCGKIRPIKTPTTDTFHAWFINHSMAASRQEASFLIYQNHLINFGTSTLQIEAKWYISYSLKYYPRFFQSEIKKGCFESAALLMDWLFRDGQIYVEGIKGLFSIW